MNRNPGYERAVSMMLAKLKLEKINQVDRAAAFSCFDNCCGPIQLKRLYDFWHAMEKHGGAAT